jgi:hypothetical protein
VVRARPVEKAAAKATARDRTARQPRRSVGKRLPST